MADTQLPLLGVIICCTSIEPEMRVSGVSSPQLRHQPSRRGLLLSLPTTDDFSLFLIDRICGNRFPDGRRSQI